MGQIAVIAIRYDEYDNYTDKELGKIIRQQMDCSEPSYTKKTTGLNKNIIVFESEHDNFMFEGDIIVFPKNDALFEYHFELKHNNFKKIKQ